MSWCGVVVVKEMPHICSVITVLLNYSYEVCSPSSFFIGHLLSVEGPSHQPVCYNTNATAAQIRHSWLSFDIQVAMVMVSPRYPMIVTMMKCQLFFLLKSHTNMTSYSLHLIRQNLTVKLQQHYYLGIPINIQMQTSHWLYHHTTQLTTTALVIILMLKGVIPYYQIW